MNEAVASFGALTLPPPSNEAPPKFIFDLVPFFGRFARKLVTRKIDSSQKIVLTGGVQTIGLSPTTFYMFTLIFEQMKPRGGSPPPPSNEATASFI